MKKCSRCHVEKQLIDFHPRNDRPGVRPKCKACQSEIAKEYRARKGDRLRQLSRDWYHANRERARATTVAWQAANIERHTAYKRKYEEAHRQEHRAAWRAWRDANRDIVRRNKAARRAHMKQARPKWGNALVIREIYQDAMRITHATGVEHVVDHIVPLQSKYVCGLHVEHNLRVITKLENEQKGNRYWPDMPEQFQPPGPAARALSLLGVSAAGAPATFADGEADGIPHH